jgi:hypothetical protein
MNRQNWINNVEEMTGERIQNCFYNMNKGGTGKEPEKGKMNV